MFTVVKYHPKKEGTYRKTTLPLIFRPHTLVADIRSGVARREEYDADMPLELQDGIIAEWIGNSTGIIYKWWNHKNPSAYDDGVELVMGTPEHISGFIIKHSREHDCRHGGVLLQRRSGEKAITLYGHIYPPYEEFKAFKERTRV